MIKNIYSRLAFKIFLKYRHRPIVVYFDPDVDGLFSGYFVCKELDKYKINYSYYINPNRQHGFKLPHSGLKGHLVIAVDFAITQEEMQSLVNNDVSVISIDHHEVQHELIHIQGESSEGLVINNQYIFNPPEDRYLSGAGVVFETIRDIDKTFNTKENKAIVGITLLSDTRPIENPRARQYLTVTYNYDCSTGYMNYLLKATMGADYGFGAPRLDRNYIDYTFSPKVNALLRFNRHDIAVKFVLGGYPELPNYRGYQKNLIQELKKNVNILELNNTIVVALIFNENYEKIINDLKFQLVQLDYANSNVDLDLTNFIGLLCSDIKGNGKSTIAFVVKDGNIRRTSFRGQYDGIDYRQGFLDLNINAQGHAGAFGILDLEVTSDIWVQIDNKVGELNQGHKPLSKIITSNNLSTILVQRGASLANENCFVRDLYRTYIRYLGTKYSIARHTTNFIEYVIDGRRVKCFNENLNPTNGLILPLLEKGYVSLYLKEDISLDN